MRTGSRAALGSNFLMVSVLCVTVVGMSLVPSHVVGVGGVWYVEVLTWYW